MTLQIGVVMDPIESINAKKDTTLALLLAAQKKGWSVQYMTQPELYSLEGVSRARVRALKVKDNPEDWFQLGAEKDVTVSPMLPSFTGVSRPGKAQGILLKAQRRNL